MQLDILEQFIAQRIFTVTYAIIMTGIIGLFKISQKMKYSKKSIKHEVVILLLR